MQPKSGLTVRRFSRHEMCLEASISISGACSSQVRLTPLSGADDGWTSATVTDVGEGGLGLATRVFIPRRCIVHVRVTHPDGGTEPLLTTDVRVQRVTMAGADQGYSLGTAFVERGPALASIVNEILARFEAAQAAPGGAGPGGAAS